jgi:cytochrome aa3-600 menaquinol oxidase subunit 3
MASAAAEREAATGRDLPLEFVTVEDSLKITGIWMFLVTDVLIFASLFSVYAVYRMRTADGPGPLALFHWTPVLVETLLLLTSSFTVSLAVWSMRRGRRAALTLWMLLTMALGLGFLSLELHEFAGDMALGAGWWASAFLSSFFVLVATHGTHVAVGLVWAGALLVQMARRGLTGRTARKLYSFALYWHFLDIVWIFIFSGVYLSARA